MKQPINIHCAYCDDVFDNITNYAKHMEAEHSDLMIPGMSGQQFIYYLKTKKTHGTCIVCKKPTKWNDVTGKYHRFCDNPRCKEKYREEFKKRMIGKYGKVHLLNDVDVQKAMLANRRISGEYMFHDGSKIPYTGTYEKNFLIFLDTILEFPSSDIMSPSPHHYYYMYEGKESFYFPDFYIPSLNLEIEIKDGGDNPNGHHKIQAVDKVKEQLKDTAVKLAKITSYLKLINKNNEPFLKFIMKHRINQINGKDELIYMIGENEVKK